MIPPTRPTRIVSFLATLGLLTLVDPTAKAAVIFTENFSSYNTGNPNAPQYVTGQKIAFGGAVTGWSGSGTGALHGVDRNNDFGQSNPSNWAIMFYDNNVITQTVGIAANVLGTDYSVTLDYGTGVYEVDYQRTVALDGLLVEVLKVDNSVLASQTFFPGAWDTAGNQNFDAGLQGAFTYTGDGSGNVRLRIGSAGTLEGRFEGAIDNLAVTSIPEPGSATILGIATLAMGLRRRRLTPS